MLNRVFQPLIMLYFMHAVEPAYLCTHIKSHFVVVVFMILSRVTRRSVDHTIGLGSYVVRYFINGFLNKDG